MAHKIPARDWLKLRAQIMSAGPDKVADAKMYPDGEVWVLGLVPGVAVDYTLSGGVWGWHLRGNARDLRSSMLTA